MDSLTGLATRKFSTLFDLVERRHAEASSISWWGPVIGSDEGTSDGSSGIFEESLVQDETGDDSDERLKTDVRVVGTTVYGLPLYQFRYTGRDELYEGVMAQDVLKVMPSAVSRGANGYYRVNYGDLGVRMQQVA